MYFVYLGLVALVALPTLVMAAARDELRPRNGTDW
jgi:hypothetical protein